MAIKDQRIYYTSRNAQAGLSDIKATVYRNADGTSTPVAVNLPLAELDPTNSPGQYVLKMTQADISGFGGVGTYLARINSATKNAPANAKFEVKAIDTDELEIHLLAMEAKLDIALANQGTMATELSSIRSTVESSNGVLTDVDFGNANLKTLLESIISSVQTVQNTTRFMATMPPRLIVPSALGTTREYEIDIRLFDTAGNHEDPDTDQIFLAIKNNTGLDRTNYVVGFTLGPVLATKVAVGVYKVRVAIPDTASIEQLQFEYTYTEVGVAFSIPRTTETAVEEVESGLALQATLLDVLTDTSDLQPRLVSLENYLLDPNHSNATLKGLLNIINGVAADTNAEVKDSVYGISAIKTILDTKSSQASLDAVANAIENDLKGVGFNELTDSLSAQSERTFFGGTAQ